MIDEGYPFGNQDLALLLIRRAYPERTDDESAIIRDFLLARGAQYERFQFSVRVGEGTPPDPAHLPAIQLATVWNSKKRIDMVVWQGPRATIVEVKKRIGPGVLGQLRTYRLLWLLERPDALEPRLVAIGRTSDPDTLRVLRAEGVDVYLYEAAGGDGGAAAGGVLPVGEGAAG